VLQDELNHPSLFLLNERLRDRNKFKIVSIVHHLRISETHPAWQKSIYAHVEKRYLQGVDAFIFNSKNTESAVYSSIGQSASVVAYPGKDRLLHSISNRVIARRARKRGPLRIVFLGNITRRKGLTTLLHALAQIPSMEWFLTAIGSLDRNKHYCRTVLKLVKRYGLDQRTVFTGLIPDTAVAENLMRSHLLVVPSQHEGFGMSYVEAMGFGLPVIGTKSGGACEVIEHGHNGFLIAPQDTQRLTGYIRQLARDRLLLSEMGINAHKSYEEFPTWRDTAKTIHGFLHSISSTQTAVWSRKNA
jgi:glycosyltransferase involved in cell wall biosynthesis